ncbi:SRPBCC family protein [Cognatitamlana onchidii]|uniref:SRPBCC family protein n=1 Tax=Cognatitamlana onchidii TaxID=2562860 RepID=UPI0010A5D0F8|nr:SRPBCC family protein [Algibacter onchidii]
MPHIEIRTEIYSDVHTCFDLARNIDFQKESLEHVTEIPFAGKTSGHIGLGEWVSWEVIHLGVVQHITSKVTAFSKPYFFVDEMILGVFKSCRHEHIFKEAGNKTIMTDKFYFELPYGVFGKLMNIFVLNRYLTKVLKIRATCLKKEAESNLGVKFITKTKMIDSAQVYQL